ncbi:unnamed protein product [Linum trigynum]|uniref:Uncharacterized protein n=1 Tax=Linum trigynum TaxID=586398 RepID=A0AAV2F911_9ROSI
MTIDRAAHCTLTCSISHFVEDDLSATLEAKSVTTKAEQHIFEFFCGLRINQVAVAVEFGRRSECVQEELGFVDEMEVKVDTNLAKMVM